MLAWKTEGTRLYQALPAQMKEHWKSCEPLTEAARNHAKAGNIVQDVE